MLGKRGAERAEVALDERAAVGEALCVEAGFGVLRAPECDDLVVAREQPLDERAADQALRAGNEDGQRPG